MTSAEMAEAATSSVLISPGSTSDFAGMFRGGKSLLRSQAAPSSTPASVRGRLLREPPLVLAGKLPDVSNELETGRLSPPTLVTGGIAIEIRGVGFIIAKMY
jgi:hypothetical protein